MRILHLADLHLGTELYGHYDAATGSSSRLADFGHVLDIAVERAIGERVDLFLFAGDAYKTRDPSPTQQRELAKRVRRLLAAGIPVFLLTGNHDMPNAVARATSLDIFGALMPEGLIVASKPGVHTVQTASGPLYVVAVPWLTRSALFAKEEHKNLTQDALHERMLERLDQALDVYEAQLTDHAVPAVLALHGTVQGASYGIERSTMLGQDLVIPKSVICRPRFSYVALGHIHKHQIVHREPLTVYAGSPERIDFGEEHEDKGYMLVELDRHHADATFVKLPARRFITFEVESDGDDPTNDAVNRIGNRDVEGAIVRVRMHLTPANQGRLHEAEIRKALRDASYVVVRRVVAQQWRDQDRGRAYSTAMTPLEVLRTYLERERAEASPEQHALLLGTGERLVAEDEHG